MRSSGSTSTVETDTHLYLKWKRLHVPRISLRLSRFSKLSSKSCQQIKDTMTCWALQPISPSTDLDRSVPGGHGISKSLKGPLLQTSLAARLTRRTSSTGWKFNHPCVRHKSGRERGEQGDELWQRIVILYRGGNMLP